MKATLHFTDNTEKQISPETGEEVEVSTVNLTLELDKEVGPDDDATPAMLVAHYVAKLFESGILLQKTREYVDYLEDQAAKANANQAEEAGN